MSRWWSLVLALLLHLAVLPFATIAAVIAPTWGTTTLVGLWAAGAVAVVVVHRRLGPAALLVPPVTLGVLLACLAGGIGLLGWTG
jgi:hypothetical protein